MSFSSKFICREDLGKSRLCFRCLAPLSHLIFLVPCIIYFDHNNAVKQVATIISETSFYLASKSAGPLGVGWFYPGSFGVASDQSFLMFLMGSRAILGMPLSCDGNNAKEASPCIIPPTLLMTPSANGPIAKASLSSEPKIKGGNIYSVSGMEGMTKSHGVMSRCRQTNWGLYYHSKVISHNHIW